MLEDELRKKHINDELAGVGLPPVYDDVVEHRGDNGERFFCQYYRQQEERNKLRVESESPVCQCPDCLPLAGAGPYSPSPPTRIFFSTLKL